MLEIQNSCEFSSASRKRNSTSGEESQTETTNRAPPGLDDDVAARKRARLPTNSRRAANYTAMRVHELHTISILCREHNCIEVKLWRSTKTKEVVRNSVSLRQGSHTITPSLQLRYASVSEPSRTDGIAACCVHSTTSKQRGFWLRLLPHSNFFFRRSTDLREEIPREKKQKHKEILYEILPTKLDSIPSRSTKFQIQTGATTTTTAELKSTLGCSRNKQFSKIHLQIHKVLSLDPLLSSAWTRARKRI